VAAPSPDAALPDLFRRDVSYTFGDSDRATRRLAVVARVFEPTSSAFIAEHRRDGVVVALDLGCGPGYTTEMLARVWSGVRCVGIDASRAYVAAAASRTQEVEFVHHDVLATPYPTPRADSIYARFLVTHLSDPANAIDVFLAQLAPDGCLLLDEVEWIRSEAPPFAAYLGHVEAMLAEAGQCLFVGPRIAEFAERTRRVKANDVRTLEVPPRDAAEMFALNWETLRTNATIVARTTAAARDALAGELTALRDGTASAPITWGLRQTAIGA
jgi:SAM-dependent methyltransferase